MFKFLFLALLVSNFFLSKPSLSQSNEFSKFSHSYLEKSKRQKKTGWILLGSGLTSFVVGTIIVGENVPDNDPYCIYSNCGGNGGAVMMAVGAAASVTSIPFFIASGKNRRRAAELSVVPGSIRVPYFTMNNRKYAALKLNVVL